MRTLVVLFLAILICTNMGCKRNFSQNHLEIAWRGSKRYDEIVSSLEISPQKARSLVTSVLANNRQQVFDQEPVMIVGSCYLFTVPGKTETRVSGYYVNGHTGAVEYRISAKTVSLADKSLSPNVFTETTLLSPSK